MYRGDFALLRSISANEQVALSHSGRVVLFSKHPSMLNVCVSSLQYLVDLRNWKGIALPMLHAVSTVHFDVLANWKRDVSLIVEDPGPYILVSPCNMSE
jgi:nicotinamide N-methyltransferase